MKIDVNSAASLPQADWSLSQSGNKSRPSADTNSGDHVTFGATANFISTLATQTMQTPQTRTDKIAQLRDCIASGAYDFDPNTTAAAMMQSGELTAA